MRESQAHPRLYLSSFPLSFAGFWGEGGVFFFLCLSFSRSFLFPFVSAFGAQEALLWLVTVCGRGNRVFRKAAPRLLRQRRSRYHGPSGRM